MRSLGRTRLDSGNSVSQPEKVDSKTLTESLQGVVFMKDESQLMSSPDRTGPDHAFKSEVFHEQSPLLDANVSRFHRQRRTQRAKRSDVRRRSQAGVDDDDNSSDGDSDGNEADVESLTSSVDPVQPHRLVPWYRRPSPWW